MEVVLDLDGLGVHAGAAGFPLGIDLHSLRGLQSQIAGKERGVSLLSPLGYHAPLSHAHYAPQNTTFSKHHFLSLEPGCYYEMLIRSPVLIQIPWYLCDAGVTHGKGEALAL